jgi:hypothetical protein
MDNLAHPSQKSQVLSHSLSIKVFPELSAAALINKVDKELSLWYELRLLDDGSGRLPLATVKRLPYSRASLYRRLSQGKGIFWEIDNTWKGQFIRPRGIAKLCVALDIPHLRDPVGIPVESWFSGGIKTKKSWLYAAFFKREGVKTNPIARDTIEKVTGISRRQQRRYEKGKVKRIANFAFQEIEGQVVPIMEVVSGKAKEYWKTCRLGNVYHADTVFLPKGMTGRVNRALRNGVDKEATPTFERRFFPSGRSFIKCHNKAQESFILSPPGRRLIPGRLEWLRA